MGAQTVKQTRTGLAVVNQASVETVEMESFKVQQVKSVMTEIV